MTALLTTQQVQELLQVDRTTIYRMVESGRLPAIRVGKQWRFPQAEIDEWLRAQTVARPGPAVTGGALNGVGPAPAAGVAPGSELAEILPLGCAQLIQDAFADILGVMAVITDMAGQPVTEVSNPCGFYTALIEDPAAAARCSATWQRLAASPLIEPRFFPSEMGLLCARGLIRAGSELKGMLVVGGIAPDTWPPTMDQAAELGVAFGLRREEVLAHAERVYHLDPAERRRALRSVQRVADIFSHIAVDRQRLCGQLQAIASLTSIRT